MKRFDARGKFLISGEYAVLDGASALAVPLNFGQVLTIEEYPDTHALWISLDENGTPWFHALIHPGTGLIVEHDNQEVAKTLEPLLRSIPDEHRRATFKGKKLTFQVDFNREYGLGSSSTMLALLASWLKLNPYKLLEHHLGGSGYDLACATAESPILFQRNPDTGIHVRPVAIPNTLWEQVSFVYSGNKQNSREGIKAYKSKPYSKELIAELTAISEKIAKSPDIQSWTKLLSQHDALLAQHLGMNQLKETFPDCPFFVKPMGAWGGDFFMALGPQKEVHEFFSKKGFNPIWKADQVVYSPCETGSKQA